MRRKGFFTGLAGWSGCGRNSLAKGARAAIVTLEAISESASILLLLSSYQASQNMHNNIPTDLNLEALPGPKRQDIVYGSDSISWSPERKHFALAYSIMEITMGNYVGPVLWGEYSNGISNVLANPYKVGVACWFGDWCHWLDEQTFVFKAQVSNGDPWQIPLVCVSFTAGYSVIPNTNNLQSRPQQIKSYSGSYSPFDAEKLLQAVISST